MTNQKHYKNRALAAAMHYPTFHPRDIGFYQTFFRNTSTREVRYHNEWRPNGRPELSVMPPPSVPDWTPIWTWHWDFPPTLEDLL